MARRKYNIEIIKQLMDGENPFYQSGYGPKRIKRKEGEEWTDGKGKTWKIKSGAKISVNKQMDTIRNMLKRICTGCGQDMDFTYDRLDHKVFPKTGKCYKCLELEEFELRVSGKWEDYEKKKIMKNKLGMLKDFKEKVIETIDFLKNDTGKMEDVMSNGDIVTFRGKANPQWLMDAERDFIKVNEEIVKMENEISKFEETVK